MRVMCKMEPQSRIIVTSLLYVNVCFHTLDGAVILWEVIDDGGLGGKKKKFCGFENLLYFLVSLGTIAMVNLLLWQQRMLTTCSVTFTWVFTGIAVSGRRLYIPPFGGENWPRDLLGDAGLAVFPHFGHKLFITGLLLANASTARQRGVMHLCRHEHLREPSVCFSFLFHLSLFVECQDQSIRVFADRSLGYWWCSLAALLCIRRAGSVGGLCC